MLFNYFHLVLLRNQTGSLQGVGCISPYFDHFLSPSVVAMSLSIFVILFRQKFTFLKNKHNVKKVIHSIARSSFGIFLIHILIIEMVDIKFNININSYPHSFSLLSFFFFRFIIVFVLSYLFTILVSRLPLIKRLIGEK